MKRMQMNKEKDEVKKFCENCAKLYCNALDEPLCGRPCNIIGNRDKEYDFRRDFSSNNQNNCFFFKPKSFLTRASGQIPTPIAYLVFVLFLFGVMLLQIKTGARLPNGQEGYQEFQGGRLPYKGEMLGQGVVDRTEYKQGFSQGYNTTAIYFKDGSTCVLYGDHSVPSGNITIYSDDNNPMYRIKNRFTYTIVKNKN